MKKYITEFCLIIYRQPNTDFKHIPYTTIPYQTTKTCRVPKLAKKEHGIAFVKREIGNFERYFRFYIYFDSQENMMNFQLKYL